MRCDGHIFGENADSVPEEPVRAERSRLDGTSIDSLYFFAAEETRIAVVIATSKRARSRNS